MCWGSAGIQPTQWLYAPVPVWASRALTGPPAVPDAVTGAARSAATARAGAPAGAAASAAGAAACSAPAVSVVSPPRSQAAPATPMARRPAAPAERRRMDLNDMELSSLECGGHHRWIPAVHSPDHRLDRWP
ncbi:MAG: hypothetical protein EA398_15370 [Deltaproteobacteria bacterium]|nr:MAG: hypothetical protein EA398_15370 [Deltaproteobacteria bacterium]